MRFTGTGTNLSPLREEDGILSGGGRASGPLSFMKGFDAFAGVIKSGGKTRRAAKMVILNADHPDIEDFIVSKSDEEKKAEADRMATTEKILNAVEAAEGKCGEFQESLLDGSIYQTALEAAKAGDARAAACYVSVSS